MITLYSGTLGSGKSYKMVAELSRCKDDYFVMHNIDHLQEGYLKEFGFNWVEYCKENNLEISDFFSKECQLDLSKQIFEKYKRPCLIIIDEAHEWFDHHVKTFKMWLSYSRHLDQEIWLVAHKSTNIPAIYRSFVGVEYRAKSSMFLNLPWWFFYNRILSGERAGYTFERKSQKIFDLYKSKEIHSKKKEKKSLMLPILIAVIILGICLFAYLPQRIAKSKIDKKPISSSQNAAAASGSPPPVQNQFSQNKEIKSIKFNLKTIEDKFSYVGEMNGEVIIEDRVTGTQLPLSYLPGEWKVIKSDRAIKCVLFNGHNIFTLYNYSRFVPVPDKTSPSGFMGEGGERQQSSPTSHIINTNI